MTDLRPATTRTQPRFGLPEVRLARADQPDRVGEVARLLCSEAILRSGEETPPAGVVLGINGRYAAAGRRGPGLGAMDLATWFDLASVTKLVTTACLMTLVNRRALSLDADVSRWVPTVNGPTVRDLLHHRGGLAAWQPLYFTAHRDPVAAIRALGEIPRQRPGVRRVYSDLGFMVLGAIVEAVAAAPLDVAVCDLITRPLGLELAYRPDDPVAAGAMGDGIERRMVQTGDPHPIEIAGGFTDWRVGPVVGEPNDGNAHHAFGGVAGHAGCFATVPALHALGSALAGAEEHSELWAPEVVAEFLAEGPDPGQAAGLRTSRLSDGRLLHHHPGFTGCVLGFVADPDPRRRAVIAIGSNRLVPGEVPLDHDGRGGPGSPGHREPVPTQRLLDTVLAATLEVQDVEAR